MYRILLSIAYNNATSKGMRRTIIVVEVLLAAGEDRGSGRSSDRKQRALRALILGTDRGEERRGQ
jgi:hypothetical protein